MNQIGIFLTYVLVYLTNVCSETNIPIVITTWSFTNSTVKGCNSFEFMKNSVFENVISHILFSLGSSK